MITLVSGLMGLVAALILGRRRPVHRRYTVHVLAITIVLFAIALARAASSRGLRQCALDLTTTEKRASAEVRR